MDRSMKVMFGMMTLAICLMAFSMIGNQSTQVYAGEYVGGADRGTEPTIVWYGTLNPGGHTYSGNSMGVMLRSWSDGTVEAREVHWGSYNSEVCNLQLWCCEDGWVVISHPNEGLAASSDLNDDENVDIEDLLAMISDWGPAPPNVIPPSDCPLAMILP